MGGHKYLLPEEYREEKANEAAKNFAKLLEKDPEVQRFFENYRTESLRKAVEDFANGKLSETQFLRVMNEALEAVKDKLNELKGPGISREVAEKIVKAIEEISREVEKESAKRPGVEELNKMIQGNIEKIREMAKELDEVPVPRKP